MIIKTNQDEFQSYLSDASNYQGTAEAVYLPENEQEVIAVVKKCNVDKIKITVSGNGTGLTGSRVPEGGIVISMEKMNRVIELNVAEKYVRVQPGMILKNLQDYVEEKKLFYPPDPTERNCFIGATVATNSSGARSFMYGSTRDYVMGMRVVLPSGETVSIERGKIIASAYNFSLATDQGTKYKFSVPRLAMPETKNASGYYCKANMDLIDLFIGSEGTLGIITELELKLITLNENVLSCVAFFEREEDAFHFIAEARDVTTCESSGDEIKISARGLEFFNKLALNFLCGDYPAIPEHTCSVWFEQELTGNDEDIKDAWLKLMQKHNADVKTSWLAVNKKEQEEFKDFRHAIGSKVNEFVARRGLRKVGTDVAVPAQSFTSFYQWMIELVERNNLEYVVYGHLGDCHTHLNMLPKNQEEFIRAKKIYSEICTEAVCLKGTVSAEHGIGKMKRDYLLLMYGEEIISQMAKLKLVFDPNKILNIGNIFDERYLQ
ncbi:d-lactate dehydrogenase (cytochrome) [hydrocarbon metagenome]|uniref:D-lactate dehydrogenase (cytochrome) n=1 Tax=hydrocarbon metagenome TaxID=938273 RepID=A0A0W8FQF4_9ZZZZ